MAEGLSMLLTETMEFLDNMANQRDVREQEIQHYSASPPFQMKGVKQKLNNRDMLVLSVLGKTLLCKGSAVDKTQ